MILYVGFLSDCFPFVQLMSYDPGAAIVETTDSSKYLKLSSTRLQSSSRQQQTKETKGSAGVEAHVRRFRQMFRLITRAHEKHRDIFSTCIERSDDTPFFLP